MKYAGFQACLVDSAGVMQTIGVRCPAEPDSSQDRTENKYSNAQ